MSEGVRGHTSRPESKLVSFLFQVLRVAWKFSKSHAQIKSTLELRNPAVDAPDSAGNAPNSPRDPRSLEPAVGCASSSMYFFFFCGQSNPDIFICPGLGDLDYSRPKLPISLVPGGASHGPPSPAEAFRARRARGFGCTESIEIHRYRTLESLISYRSDMWFDIQHSSSYYYTAQHVNVAELVGCR